VVWITTKSKSAHNRQIARTDNFSVDRLCKLIASKLADSCGRDCRYAIDVAAVDLYSNAPHTYMDTMNATNKTTVTDKDKKGVLRYNKKNT